jgi:hypothetical protein
MTSVLPYLIQLPPDLFDICTTMLAFGLRPCASQIKLSQEIADSQIGISVMSKLLKLKETQLVRKT